MKTPCLMLLTLGCTGCATPATNLIRTHDGAYTVQWSLVDTDTIPLDEYFAIKARVSPPPHTLAIDAVMPSHRHGMLNDATMEQIDPDTWIAHDMLFHMHGHWRFRFDATDADGVVHRAQADVELE